MNETLQELVAQRRGYKYLDKNGISPYQNYAYDLKSRRIMVTEVDTDPSNSCGPGWNLATLKWIADNCLKLDGGIVEFAIPKTAQIIVPHDSDGKFRTDKIKIVKVHPVEASFPLLKDINGRLKNYKPINPITAETMPPANKIKKIRAQVWAQVGDQVGAQVGDQVGAQDGDQVGDQVRVCAYQAVAEFFNLDYDHPAFDLIRLGIMVVNVLGKFKVFGNGGKYLGEVEP